MPRLPASPAAPCEALVLAAGRGERMRPLTDTCPKPLLPVRGKPLMQWTLEALGAAGVARVAVNTGWLGEQVAARLGPQLPLAGGAAGARGVALAYSREDLDFGYALETLGGIVRALPLLADVFWVAAGDVHAPDFAFAPAERERFRASGQLAHLWLVPNPPHHPQGDFGLGADGLATHAATPPGAQRYTYSTIALFRRALFEAPWCDVPAGNPQGAALPLAPLLRRAIDAGQVGASLYTGRWTDVGTPERLAALNQGDAAESAADRGDGAGAGANAGGGAASARPSPPALRPAPPPASSSASPPASTR